MCDHWPLELAVNGHWYGVLGVRVFVSSRGSSDGVWWFCCVGMAPLAS